MYVHIQEADLSRGEVSIELGPRSTESKLQLIEIRTVIIIIPSSTLVGALVLAELKDRLLCIFLEEPGWCPKTPLSQHLLPSLIHAFLYYDGAFTDREKRCLEEGARPPTLAQGSRRR